MLIKVFAAWATSSPLSTQGLIIFGTLLASTMTYLLTLSFTHSLTVQAHDCLMNCVFDALSFCCCRTALSGRSIKFYDSYNSKNYAFSNRNPCTLEGGGIIISAWGEEHPDPRCGTSGCSGCHSKPSQ